MLDVDGVPLVSGSLGGEAIGGEKDAGTSYVCVCAGGGGDADFGDNERDGYGG